MRAKPAIGTDVRVHSALPREGPSPRSWVVVFLALAGGSVICGALVARLRVAPWMAMLALVLITVVAATLRSPKTILIPLTMIAPFYQMGRIILQRAMGGLGSSPDLLFGGWQDLLVAIAVLACVAQMAFRKQAKPQLDLVALLGLLFVGLGLAGILVAPSLSGALYAFRRSYLYVLLFLFLSEIRFSDADLQRFVTLTLIALAGSAVVSVASYVIWGPQALTEFRLSLGLPTYGFGFGGQVYQRWSGTFLEPPYASLAYAILCCMSLAILLGGRAPIALRAFPVLGMVAMLLSGGRAGWIAALAATAIVVWFNRVPGRRHRVVRWAAIGITVAAFMLSSQGLLAEAALSVFRVGVIGSDIRRLEYWMGSIQNVLRNPLGLGTGSALAGQERIFGWSSQAGQPISLDSFYLKIGVEIGVVGLAVFVLLLALGLRAGFHVCRSLREKSAQRYCVGLLATLVATAVAAITDNTLDFYPSSFYAWSVLAILVSVHRFGLEPCRATSDSSTDESSKSLVAARSSSL